MSGRLCALIARARGRRDGVLLHPQHRVARLRRPARRRHRVLGRVGGRDHHGLGGLAGDLRGQAVDRGGERRVVAARDGGRLQSAGAPAAPILIACAPSSSRAPVGARRSSAALVASGSFAPSVSSTGARTGGPTAGPPRWRRASRRGRPGRPPSGACPAARREHGLAPRRPRRRPGPRRPRASCSLSRSPGSRGRRPPRPRRPSGQDGRVSVAAAVVVALGAPAAPGERGRRARGSPLRGGEEDTHRG